MVPSYKSATTTIEVLDAVKRPVTLAGDHAEVRDVASVTVMLDPIRGVQVGFDPDHQLEERILDESFAISTSRLLCPLVPEAGRTHIQVKSYADVGR